MDEITEKIELRDGVMKRMYLALAPEQRMARMRQLHQWGLERLAAYPPGMDHFIRRNLARRSITPPHGL